MWERVSWSEYMAVSEDVRVSEYVGEDVGVIKQKGVSDSETE